MNSLLGKINRLDYQIELNTLSDNLVELNDNAIKVESDVTRIADYKVGNVSLFTLSSLLLNKGAKESKTINFFN